MKVSKFLVFVVALVLAFFAGVMEGKSLRPLTPQAIMVTNVAHEVTTSRSRQNTVVPSLGPPVDLALNVLEAGGLRLEQLRDSTHGFITTNDLAQIKKIQQEILEDLGRISPEASNSHKISLFKQTDFGKKVAENFGASDHEILAIADYMARKEQLLTSIPPEPALGNIQKEMREDLRRLIGEDRSTSFIENFQDPNYQQILAFCQRVGYTDPTSEATKLTLFRRDALIRISRGERVNGTLFQNELANMIGRAKVDLLLQASDSSANDWLFYHLPAVQQ